MIDFYYLIFWTCAFRKEGRPWCVECYLFFSLKFVVYMVTEHSKVLSVDDNTCHRENRFLKPYQNTGPKV